MLSLPILARLYNYLNAKAISANWYKATFPKRGSYLECSGCRMSGATDAEGSLEHGAVEARSWFSSVAGKAFDAGARFPLAWCLQQLFYAPPRGSKLVGLLREGAATIKSKTLIVWRNAGCDAPWKLSAGVEGALLLSLCLGRCLASILERICPLSGAPAPAALCHCGLRLLRSGQRLRFVTLAWSSKQAVGPA